MTYNLHCRTSFSLERRRCYYIIYTALFVLLFILSYGIFALYGKSPVWSADGIRQHYPNVVYLNRWFKEIWNNLLNGKGLLVPQWDSTIGFGENIFNVISLRPIAWLSIFFSEDNLVNYLWFSMAIRMYLVGVFFSEYAFYMRFDRFASLVGALTYTFCTYAIYNAPRQYLFIDMMFCLPLIYLGIEKILRENKLYTFIAGVAVSACSNFYMLYIVIMFAMLYFFVSFFFQPSHKTIKNFVISSLQCVGGGLFGLLIALFSLLPSLQLAFQSNRAGSVVNPTYTSNWHYLKSFYTDCITHLFNGTSLYTGLVLGFSGLAGIAVLFVLFSGKRKYAKYYIQLILIALLVVIPVGAYIFNGFSGKTQRYGFGLHFLLAVIVTAVLNDLPQIKDKVLLRMLGAEVLYLVTLIVLFCLGEDVGFIGVISLFIFNLWLFYVKCSGGVSRIICKSALVILILIDVGIKSFGMFSPYGDNYLDEFHDAQTLQDESSNLVAAAVKQLDDDGVYRVDEIDNDFYDSVFNGNYGLRVNVNGLSSFYSYTGSGLEEYTKHVGLAQQPAPFCVLGLTHRTALNSLNSVKYITVNENTKSIFPYGYELVKTVQVPDEYGEVQNVNIYRNNYYLPYMYCYESYIPKNSYLSLSPTQREQAMLQGVVLDESVDLPQTDLAFDKQSVLRFDEVVSQLKSGANSSDYLIVSDNCITTLRNNVSVVLSFDGLPNSETYIELNDLEFVPISKSQYADRLLSEHSSKMDKLNLKIPDLLEGAVTAARITIDNSQSIYLNDEFNQYYVGAVDAVGNLGFYKEPLNQVRLTFAAAGKYYFSNFEVTAQPMTNYPAAIDQLLRFPVNDIKFSDNGISGSVELYNPSMIFINVPYDSGWSAYINGKEVEIFRANEMYMAVYGQKGVNEIQLRYKIPGIKIGCIVSLTAFTLYLACVMFSITRNNHSKLRLLNNHTKSQSKGRHLLKGSIYRVMTDEARGE